MYDHALSWVLYDTRVSITLYACMKRANLRFFTRVFLKEYIYEKSKSTRHYALRYLTLYAYMKQPPISHCFCANGDNARIVNSRIVNISYSELRFGNGFPHC